jgi:hypothetical protein
VSELNLAPLFVGLTNATVPELVGYTQRLFGADDDLPAQPLTLALVSGPAGAVVTNGVFAWTPSEVQGPSTNTVAVAVSDGVVTTTNLFAVTVREVNTPPIATVATNRFQMDELTALTVTNTAGDVDLPANKLTWRVVSTPAGATLNATNGLWSWTPGEAQGPSTNEVVVAVDDTGAPPLSATNRFTVVVREVNQLPRFTGLTNAEITELIGYTQRLFGADDDLPAQPLTLALVSGPAGAVVTNGVFAWTPTEAQGPSTNEVRVSVSDGSITVTNGFHLRVAETNQPPTLVAPENLLAEVGRQLAAQFLASDSDLPPQALTFELVVGPPGAVVDPVTGLLRWTPSAAQSPSTNAISVRVRDGVSDGLATFTVTVRSLEGLLTLRLSLEGAQVVLRWPTASGPVVVEQSDSLPAGWQPVATLPQTEGSDSVVRLNAGDGPRFFRLTRP